MARRFCCTNSPILDQSGRTILITGATSGLGRAASIALAKRGANLVLSCRDPSRGRSLMHDLTRESGHSRYSHRESYAMSKLANLLFMLELQKRLPQGVTVNTLYPGSFISNIGRDVLSSIDPLTRFCSKLIQRLTFSLPEKACGPLLFLATDPSVETVTGAYYRGFQKVSPSSAAQDMEAAKALWDFSEKTIRAILSRRETIHSP